MSEIASVIVVVVGAFFCALAGVGLLRFPDLYTRLHAASKAGPLGAGLMLLGLGIASGDPLTFAKCLVGMIFLLLTAPLSAHLLARAALKSGTRPSQQTSINEHPESHAEQSRR
jgi:multicomponent Na+:H+ antiporter subunit G